MASSSSGPPSACVHLAHVREHRGLARRLVDRPALGVLHAADRIRATRPAVEQPHEHLVDLIDLGRAGPRRSAPQPSHVPLHFARRGPGARRARRPPARAPSRPRRRRPTAPTARTCSGRENPKPSASGRSVSARTRAASASAESATSSRTPGDAEPRDAVEEAAASSAARRIARHGGRRAQEENCIKAVGRERGPRLAGFLGRQVEHQHAVDAGGAAPARAKAVEAHPQHRVGVGEEHQRRPHRRRAGWPPCRAPWPAWCRRPAPVRWRAGSPGRRPADRRTARRAR